MGEIWYFFLREKPVATSEQTAIRQEILPPPQELQPLLPPSEELATEETAPNLPPPITQPAAGLLTYHTATVIGLADLKTLGGQTVGEDELIKLIIRTGTATAPDGETETAEINTIDKVIRFLKIKIPLPIKNQSTGEFDVFAFGGNAFDQDACQKAKNTLASCYGPRLGLAVRVVDPIKISGALRAWEKTMAADLKSLVLAKVGSAATTVFQTGTYQGQIIRYKNLPLNTITVEYALVDDILIITTSKSSMLKAIDSVKSNSDSDELSE